jgi:hypothetical protein
MHIGKGAMQYRPSSLAHIAAEQELVTAYAAYKARVVTLARPCATGGTLGGHEAPQRAVPIPRAGRPQPLPCVGPAKRK